MMDGGVVILAKFLSPRLVRPDNMSTGSHFFSYYDRARIY